MASTLTTITTTLFTGLIFISITAMVNIKIKYAQSEAQAKRSVALVFWRIIYGCSLLFVVLVLYGTLVSPEPLTRSSIMIILLGSLNLFSAFLAYILLRFLKVIFSLFEKGGYVDNKLIHMVMNLPCQPPEIKKLAENDRTFKDQDN